MRVAGRSGTDLAPSISIDRLVLWIANSPALAKCDRWKERAIWRTEQLRSPRARGTSYTGLSRPLGWSGNPFRVMQRLVDEMDRMFDDFRVGGRSPLSRETGGQMWAPDVEVLQRNNELIIRLITRLKPDEVSVDVTENSVIIIQGDVNRSTRKSARATTGANEFGSFHRVIPLAEGAISDQAKATFRDGVLQITMPAPPKLKGRRLEVTEGTKDEGGSGLRRSAAEREDRTRASRITLLSR